MAKKKGAHFVTTPGIPKSGSDEGTKEKPDTEKPAPEYAAGYEVGKTVTDLDNVPPGVVS